MQDSIPALEKLSLKHTPKSDHKTPSELELERLGGKDVFVIQLKLIPFVLLFFLKKRIGQWVVVGLDGGCMRYTFGEEKLSFGKTAP